MTDFDRFAPVVQKAFAAFEAHTDRAQKVMEEMYLDLVKTDEAKACELLNRFNQKVIADALALAEDLTNRCVTMLTDKIEATVPFRNGKHVD